MESSAPSKIRFDDEYESPKMATAANVKFSLFDTHAMAYKLLLIESGCGDEKEDESISEHGKEARMDFYLNRSRSDGASTIMKQNLEEMKQRKSESEIGHETENEIIKRRSSFGNQRSVLVAPTNRRENEEEKKIDPPLVLVNERPPMFIPAVDSCEHLLTYERTNQTSIDNRRKLFTEHRFVPYFTLPSPSFILHCLLDERTICLESYVSKNAQFTGTLLIKHSPCVTVGDKNTKRVYVRKTLDDWKRSEDTEAEFLEASKERPSVDRYSFRLPFTDIRSGVRLEFALAYEIHLEDGQIISYWDNNNKANYAFWYSA